MTDVTSTCACALTFSPPSSLRFYKNTRRRNEERLLKSKAYRDVATLPRWVSQIPLLSTYVQPICSHVITELVPLKPETMPAFKVSLYTSTRSYLAEDILSLSLCTGQIDKPVEQPGKPAQKEQQLHNFNPVCG